MDELHSPELQVGQISLNLESDTTIDDILEKISIENRQESFHMLNIGVFVGLLLLIGMLMLFLTRPTVSEVEKRELTKFPSFSVESLLSGDYTKSLSNFYADTVPFRENIVGMGAYFKNLYGIRYDDIRFHDVVRPPQESEPHQSAVVTTTAAVTTAAQNEPPATTQAPSSQTETTVSGNIQDYVNNGIVVLGDRGLMLFGGNKTQATRYADAVNSYQKALGDAVRVYSLVVPTAVDFYLPQKYRNLSTEQKPNLDFIATKLDPKVTFVDLFTPLQQHKEEPIFMRTDHHWAQLGAYYAYEAFAKAAGVNCPPLSSYTKKAIPGYVGTLYGFTNDTKLKDSPEDFTYYLPGDKYTTTYYNYGNANKGVAGPLFFETARGSSCYSLFLGGDAKITQIVTENKNGRIAAVFKDSFGNAFAPYLVSSFEEVYVIDIRYFEKNAIDFLKQHGVTDVLFVNNIFAANTSSLIGHIETIRDQKEFVATRATTVTTPAPQTTPVPDTTAAPPVVTTAPEPAVSPADAPVATAPETAPPTTTPPPVT